MTLRTLLRHVKSHATAALIAVSLVAVFGVQAAHAYTTSGSRWRSNADITYQLQPMQQYDLDGFYNGISAWNSAPTPVFFVSGGRQVTMYDKNAGNSGWDGMESDSASTFYCQNPSGYDQFAYAWVELNSYYTSAYPAGAIQSVAAHELGHAIGLGHSGSQTLMAPTTDRWWTYNINSPQQDDINGADYLYGRSC